MDLDIMEIRIMNHFNLKPNDLVVFQLAEGVNRQALNSFYKAMSEWKIEIEKMLNGRISFLIVSSEIENISQVPEEEMEKMGWVRKNGY